MYHCIHCHLVSNNKRGWYTDGLGGTYCPDCMDLAIDLLDEVDEDAREPAQDDARENARENALMRRLMGDVMAASRQRAYGYVTATVNPGAPTARLFSTICIRCASCNGVGGWHYEGCATETARPRDV